MAAMKTYRIWSRVTPIDGTDRYLCVVVAIPVGDDEDEHSSEAESRVLTRELAYHSCAAMAAAMAERIRKRGDAVTSIEHAEAQPLNGSCDPARGGSNEAAPG
jgi:hypothetical protein